MYHIPICPICDEFEVGTFDGNEHYCSDSCEDKAHEYVTDAMSDVEYDDEMYPDDRDGFDYPEFD